MGRKTNELKLELFTFKMPSELREIADMSIKVRHVLNKFGQAENFSEYLRKLILEDWERNKKTLVNLKKTQMIYDTEKNAIRDTPKD